MQDKIIEMLARGYSAAVVSSALGVTESYISQLQADQNIRDQIATKRMAALTAKAETDDSIDELENKALARMHQLIPLVTKPMEALRIFQVANTATRRAAPTLATEAQGVTVVLNLPEAAAVQFKLSTDKQVVEVDGRSLSSMPSKQLTAKLQAQKMLVNMTTPKLQVRNVHEL